MKTQRRAVDGHWPGSRIAEAGSRIAEDCVALVSALATLIPAIVNGTASQVQRMFFRAVFELSLRTSTPAQHATNSLQPIGSSRQIRLHADGVSRHRHPSPSNCLAWMWRTASVVCSHRISLRVRAERLPENSPFPVRVSPEFSLQPVVPVASPGTERQHGEGDLYFQHAA